MNQTRIPIYSDLATQTWYATVSAIIFFMPHASTRVFENAFTLPYKGVNIGVFYIGMILLTLISYLTILVS